MTKFVVQPSGGLFHAPVFLLFHSLRGMRRILVQQQHPFFQSGAGVPAPRKKGTL